MLRCHDFLTFFAIGGNVDGQTQGIAMGRFFRDKRCMTIATNADVNAPKAMHETQGLIEHFAFAGNTPVQLETMFDDSIVQAVVCLTKHYYGKESYRDYLKRCAKNPIASMVKFHDMSFNMLNCVREGRVSKQNRYLASMQQLQEFITKYQGVEID